MTTDPGPESRPDRPEPAQATTDAREELRDRIEAAMRRDDFSIPTMADAVMPVVEADVARIAKDAAEVIAAMAARRDQADERARANLDAIAEVVLLLDEQGRRAEKAEAAVQRVRTLALRARHAAVDTWHLDITGTPPTATVPADDIIAALDQEAGQ